jgi:hypothetical protein
MHLLCSLGQIEAPTPSTERPKPVFYDRPVLASEKLGLIHNYMTCNFQNYYDVAASPLARSFVFQLPNPGKVNFIF